MPPPTTISPISMMVAALDSEPSGRRRWNAPSRRLEKMDRTCCISTKNVVVLMPPPVEPGDAPMNIKIMMTSRPALLMLPTSTLEKPAVRAVMLEKRRQPAHVVGQLQKHRAAHQQHRCGGEHDLGVERHSAKLPAAAPHVQNDHEADAAHNDESASVTRFSSRSL